MPCIRRPFTVARKSSTADRAALPSTLVSAVPSHSPTYRKSSNVRGSDTTWTRPLPAPAAPPPAGLRAAAGELRWAAAFLGTWLGRRLRGRSSGDGRTAKRPDLLPVTPA